MSNNIEVGQENTVLNSIKSGEIKMRSKWYFLVKAGLLLFCGVILFLTLMYLAGLIVFALHETGVWEMPNFGVRGWYVFVLAMPWLLVLALIICAVILELLAKQHTVMYRKPLVYSILAMAIIIGAGGYIVYSSSLHGRRLPFVKPMFNKFGDQKHRDVHRGAIIELRSSGFLIKNRYAENLIIFITPRTRLPYGNTFYVGDIVVVFGDRSEYTVQAYGVKKIRD